MNVNKVATIRNARLGAEPRPLEAAQICLRAGAAGITVHPRPDGRHIRSEDVRALAGLLRDFPGAELNVEGNPFPQFLELVTALVPDQCTLVPDLVNALTSNSGWDLRNPEVRSQLRPTVERLRDLGIRVSLFLEPDEEQLEHAASIGADRIELYTEPYASAFATPMIDVVLGRYADAARSAAAFGLGVNAGHDLNLDNLGLFCSEVPGVLEVSIGHALISRGFEVGLAQAVREYLEILGWPVPSATNS